jgi:hypothetical protein
MQERIPKARRSCSIILWHPSWVRPPVPIRNREPGGRSPFTLNDHRLLSANPPGWGKSEFVLARALREAADDSADGQSVVLSPVRRGRWRGGGGRARRKRDRTNGREGVKWARRLAPGGTPNGPGVPEGRLRLIGAGSAVPPGRADPRAALSRR